MKKITAMVLSLVMCFSYVPTTSGIVFADSNEDQTMEGFFVVKSDGTVEKTVSEGTVKHSSGFTLDKDIEQTGENQFNIKLKVKTTQKIITKDAAIELIIDVSNSMKYCADCGASGRWHDNNCPKPGSRLDAVRKILTENGGFLDSLVNDYAGGKIYLSVVKYSGGTTDEASKKVTDWIDIAEESNLKAVKNVINGLKANGGTNIEAGLALADNRLAMKDIESVGPENRFSVLLTDGQPTMRVPSEVSKTETERITSNTDDGSGNSTSQKEYDETKAAATELKKNCKLYTIYYGNDSDTFSVGYSKVKMSDFLKSLSSGNDFAYTAANAAGIESAFDDIASSTTQGLTGEGTRVIDPMGANIKLGNIDSLVDQGATKEGNTLIWDLNPEKATKETIDHETTYTYELTYPISLDTTSSDFEEGKYYQTNGYTTLNVPKEDGSNEVIPFNVPGVKGKTPITSYSVEFYKQGDADKEAYDKYTLVSGDTIEGKAIKLHTEINVENIASDYANKYDDDNYHYVKGTPVSMKAQLDKEKNVIKLFYAKDEKVVSVQHYYKTKTINKDGSITYTNKDGEVSDFVWAATPDAEESSKEYIGKPYEGTEQTSFGAGVYELKKVEPSKTITVTKDGDNTIKFFYQREVDNRDPASIVVDHVYRTKAWEIENGKFVLKNYSETVTGVEKAENLKATTKYAAKNQPISERTQFKPDPNNEPEITLVGGENKITLYFDRVIDERKAVEVTVVHHYTKTEVKIGADGKPYDDIKEYTDTETKSAYLGEDVEITEQNNYGGDAYKSDEGNGAKLHIAGIEGDKTIDLYYSLYNAPDKTFVKVKHIYRNHISETVEVVDDKTGEVTGTEVKERTETDEEVVTSESIYYVGEEYTAALKGKEGYDFNKEESDALSQHVLADGKTEITLYYDKYEEQDNRDRATIDVKHNYFTNLTHIVAGEVRTEKLSDGSYVAGPFNGKVGDSFTPEQVPLFNGKTYEYMGGTIIQVILQQGSNETIELDYDRDQSDLVKTTYTVDYVYKTYERVIKDGKAVWDEPTVEKGKTFNGEGYVGEAKELKDGAKEGFNPMPGNPGTSQILGEKDNHWTFEYEKRNDLDKGKVIVKHHYNKITINPNGEKVAHESTVDGINEEMYVGETVIAKPLLNGFDYDKVKVTDGSDYAQDDATKDVTVTTAKGTTVVDFYYTTTEDLRVSADFSIIHEYYTYNQHGDLINSSVAEPITGNGYVGIPVSAAVDTIGNTYDLISAELNGKKLSDFDKENPKDSYQVELVNGENKIVFKYRNEVNTVVDARIKVTHNYFARDLYNADPKVSNVEYIADPKVSPEAVDEAMVYGNDDGWIRNDNDGEISYSYIVEPILEREKEPKGPYEFLSANPEDLTIVVNKVTIAEDMQGRNVIPEYEIVVNYIREYDTTPEEPPIDIPDDPIPGGDMPDTPDPGSDIPDTPVPGGDKPPVVDTPEQNIPDNDIPMGSIPKTGDETGNWLLIAILSFGGLLGIFIGKKSKKTE